MKDRFVTLAGALASLVLVIALLLPQDPPSPPVSKPTTADRGELGLVGLKRWLELNGIATTSLRRRYTELGLRPEIPESGNLLISSIPHGPTADARELEALRAWMDQGNRVLVLAAMNDLPDWALVNAREVESELMSTLGFRFEQRPTKPEVAASETVPQQEPTRDSTRDRLAAAIDDVGKAIGGLRRTERTLVPAAPYPSLAGIGRVATRTTSLAVDGDWRLTGAFAPRLARPLLIDAVTREPVFWVVRSGNTIAWISSYPDLFGNRTLGEADNARLLQNLLNAALDPGGRVIFDDLHQGLSALYDPEAFFRDKRLWNTLGFVFVFWLLYVAGYTNRLAPPVRRRDQVEASLLVEAMAGLFARRLSPLAAGRALLNHFVNDVRLHHRLPATGHPCWEVLAADPRVPPEDLQALRRMADRLDAGNRPDLQRLASLLHTMRDASK